MLSYCITVNENAYLFIVAVMKTIFHVDYLKLFILMWIQIDKLSTYRLDLYKSAISYEKVG